MERFGLAHGMNLRRALCAGVALLALAPGMALAAAPSFDCARARTPVDRSICQAPRLAVLDGILGRYYLAARHALPPPQRQCLAADQRAWLAGQRDGCDGAACLEQRYLERLGELEGLLPGSALDRRLEAYPSVQAAPVLAVLPPASDAPVPADGLQEVRMEGRPLEDEGGYVLVDGDFDRVAWEDFVALQGDEDALRARFGDGPVHVEGVVGSFSGLSLGDRERAAIDGVASRGGSLRVRGWAEYTDAAPPSLDSRRCGFVHALPPVPVGKP